jgi:hypothetical protein
LEIKIARKKILINHMPELYYPDQRFQLLYDKKNPLAFVVNRHLTLHGIGNGTWYGRG